jgi:hypothetical protein
MVPTHSLLDGQAMLETVPAELTPIIRHELGRVGFVLTTTLTPSSAMQNLTRGQLTALAWRRTRTFDPFHTPGPPVGFVDVNTSPA